MVAYRLMKEATINAKQAGERGISAKSVKKVTEVLYHSISDRPRYARTNSDRLGLALKVQRLSGLIVE